MPKRKRGARDSSRFKPEELLDSMAGMGLPANMRLVALAVYSFAGADPALETLGWRTGLSTLILKSQIEKLESYGFLIKYEASKWKITLPNERPEKIQLKRIKTNEPTPGAMANTLIEVYKKLWLRKYRKVCSVNGTSRTKALGLIKELGYEEAKIRLENFMMEDDKWIAQRSHAFHIFAKLSNQYTRRPHARQEEARIAEHGRGFEEEVEEFEKREGQRSTE